MSFRTSISRTFRTLATAIVVAIGRLDKSLSPSDTINRLRSHKYTYSDAIYIFHLLLASFWLTIMEVPPFPYKLIIPILYSIALLIPFTCQFFIPATPIFAWVLSFYSNRFIPSPYRPSVHVALLPTLESVLYGANVSDILTRFTHPLLDIIAWIPYGVLHYTLPFVVAFFIWLFRYPLVLRTWAKTFGYMNLIGVLTQIILPCAAPWYELIYGLTPASYATPGSAGGLARIDAIFHSNGYQATFASSPLVFGAFPSLHAAWATLEALFLSHYFPHMSKVVWIYAGVLYWSTMYLTHHYLIDVVGGACLAVAAFYGFFPEELRDKRAAVARPFRVGRSKYEVYDLEERRGIVEEFEEEFASEESTRSEDGEEDGITF
ncbi:hypothetical protein SERLA73DRAFT_169749, partial [Serpula lacrymans var. lacrymans S7.3]